MPEDREYLKELVKARLYAMPPNVSFSIGGIGSFTRNELIHEVEGDTEVGKATMDMQLRFLRRLPNLINNSV